MKAAQKTPFNEKGDKYEGVLTGDEGQQIKIVPGSLGINDTKSAKPTFSHDDGEGRIDGAATGTIDYPSGKASMKFPQEKRPDSAKNLEASFRYRGQSVGCAYALCKPCLHVREGRRR